MDLLYSQIRNIPQNEKISGVYLVDGIVRYASTYSVSTNIYVLYEVSNHCITDKVTLNSHLCSFDAYIMNENMPIQSLSGCVENGLRVVRCNTLKKSTVATKLPDRELMTTNRHSVTRRRKLF